LGCTQGLAVAPSAAAAFSEAAGAPVGVAALLAGALGGAVALGGVEGACAQIGVAIARTAARATPLNRCFIVQPPNRTCKHARFLARAAIRLVCHLTVEEALSCFARHAKHLQE
jgi:hypothetical protein